MSIALPVCWLCSQKPLLLVRHNVGIRYKDHCQSKPSTLDAMSPFKNITINPATYIKHFLTKKRKIWQLSAGNVHSSNDNNQYFNWGVSGPILPQVSSRKNFVPHRDEFILSSPLTPVQLSPPVHQLKYPSISSPTVGIAPSVLSFQLLPSAPASPQRDQPPPLDKWTDSFTSLPLPTYSPFHCDSSTISIAVPPSIIDYVPLEDDIKSSNTHIEADCKRGVEERFGGPSGAIIATLTSPSMHGEKPQKPSLIIPSIHRLKTNTEYSSNTITSNEVSFLRRLISYRENK